MSKCRVCDAGPAGQRLHKCPNSSYYIPGSDRGAEYDNPAPVEHVCRDGHQDWGRAEDCPNCGLKAEFDALQGLT